MTALSNQEYHLARIRQKLKEDGVKLWESPYYVDNKTVDSLLEELAFNFSDVLAIPQATVLAILKTLQLNALERLSSRSLFEKTGVATLRVKLIGTDLPLQTINIDLNKTGESLRESIVLPSKNQMKMICNGVLINSNQTLLSQKVLNNSKILVVTLSSDPDRLKVEEKTLQEIELIKADTELLAAQQEDNSLRITDQSGNILNLPIEEKKSLATAMALHEKGRAALKRNQVSLALAFFYEADLCFTGCRAEILRAVDNAGLLNLDIAWCYLLLGNAADISDAAIRLETCQQTLSRSYGTQMERLLELKGTTGNEAVLFLRLHLLQGVVAFHQGKSLEAMAILSSAEEELKKLSINDEDLSRLVDLGYSVSLARLGLRACRGNLNEACVYLQHKEEEKRERKRKDKEEEGRIAKRKKLGRTSNGEWLNLGYLETIVDMGFPRSRAVQSLKTTNNDISRAVQVLQEEMESGADEAGSFDEAELAQIVSLGVPLETAREILASYGGDVERAISELDPSNPHPRSENPSSSTENSSESEKHESECEKERKAAYKRFAKDLPASEDDHLNSNLELEAEYLHRYLAFLKGS